jgi:hypothetical protein
VTRRPGDQLDSTIALIAVVMVMMSVTMTVIVHGEVRPIDNPLTMLPDAAQFGRCGRRAAYEEAQQLAAPNRARDNRRALRIDAVNLENVLRVRQEISASV